MQAESAELGDEIQALTERIFEARPQKQFDEEREAYTRRGNTGNTPSSTGSSSGNPTGGGTTDSGQSGSSSSSDSQSLLPA